LNALDGFVIARGWMGDGRNNGKLRHK
jgi:hypothetical protein